ncbi:hypothetical protein COE80_19350 [Bacillus pseudomycoides]|uniref:hypothetical protein n=1 Tax=Bacillus pseudomycoides TaxID=64104 RepID=UPI000BFCCB22|nr:hypothetical protein [Bacillus pseudomycoides]PHB23070.1 hypothetical protein COE80_19350 [Bacillus pseudomycoides]PHE37599.1 hypothetical protein COF51_16315 [Bacillus pseudomycoides]
MATLQDIHSTAKRVAIHRHEGRTVDESTIMQHAYYLGISTEEFLSVVGYYEKSIKESMKEGS